MNPIIECELCPRHCRLKNGERGNCRVRIHLDGKLFSLAYGNPCAVHVDPIEKKPQYHVLPGSQSFSIATAGCNLHCKGCQNWEISQRSSEETDNIHLPPDAVVAHALENKCQSISYTYSDPVVFYEYMLDTSLLAHKHNLLNIMVTAGYIEKKPLAALSGIIDAAHVDLKGITEEFYRDMTGATLKPVQDSILQMQKQGTWVELINLIIPTWNDQEKDIRALCRWVKENAGPEMPLHFSRFFPMHQLKNLPPTPEETLTRAWEIAKQEGIHYPYVGNLPNHPGNHTYCPLDGKLLIRRTGYSILDNNIENGQCRFCGHPIPGIWSIK